MKDNRNNLKSKNFSAVLKNTLSKKVSFQHYHDSYEIQFFINVDLEIFIKDIKYKISDGDVIFINEFDIHRFIYKDTSTVYSRYIVNFKKDYILPCLKPLGIESVLDYLKDSRFTYASTTLKERTELESLFKSLINASNSYSEKYSGNFQEAAVKSYLLLILMRIWELIKNYEPANTMSKKSKLIKDIIHFIDKNYMNAISLDILEENFFTDKFYISHVFSEVTGFTLTEYVQQKRIIEAQKMLKNTSAEIIDICFDCGFNSTQHFYRVFKKISDMTPDKYRKI